MKAKIKEEKKKPEEVKEIGKGIYKNMGGKTGIFSGGWNEKQAKEWLDDCNLNYDGLRRMKMWTDHLKARAYDAEQELITSQMQQQQQQNQQEEEEEDPLAGCIGGKKEANEVKGNG